MVAVRAAWEYKSGYNKSIGDFIYIPTGTEIYL